MNILSIGTEEQAEECRQKFGLAHTVRAVPHAAGDAAMQNADVIFDFNTPTNPSRVGLYKVADQRPVFFDTSLTRLSDVLKPVADWKNPMFGFCGLRTFVNREMLEVALRRKDDRAALEMICTTLGTSFRVVADQPGMITPRIICMIINEAYCTLEEGIASREDIDVAMKLGTNYPWGPFEWGERIGLGNVVAVLAAARRDRNDPRYEACNLLKKTAR